MKFRIHAHVKVLAMLAGLSTLTSQLSADPLGTAFTYQGKLTDGGSAANGNYDLRFELYDAPTAGVRLAGPITNSAVAVSNGLFTVTLDFGSSAFTGAPRWLQLGVRGNGVAAEFAMLAPRQPLTPTPYALYAPAADTAATAGAVAPGAVTGAGIAAGQVVRSLNTLQDTVTLAAGTNVSIQSVGNTLTISAAPGTVVTNAGWGLSGNTGTTANNFLGTTDGQALELRVNSTRALRVEPTASTPNLIGGFQGNSVSAGLVGVHIGGGGLAGSEHTALGIANYGTIGGGYHNTILGYGSLIGGGRNNVIGAGANDSVIAGGFYNTNDAYRAALLGGRYNIIKTNSDHAFLGAGYQNQVEGGAASVLGGMDNVVESLQGVVLGGQGNRVREASILQTTIPADRSLIGAGLNNTVLGASHFFLGGGQDNSATVADWGVLGGGSANRVTADYTFLGGGQDNTNGAIRAVLAGGQENRLVSGADNSFIGSGWLNYIAGTYSSIVGGSRNSISGDYATVPGGYLNQANGTYSFAAGNRAKALHPGSFVWADSTSADFASTGTNQFLVRAWEAGINTANPQATLDIVTHSSDQFALRLQNAARDGWASIEMADGAGRRGDICFNYGTLPEKYGEMSPQIGFYLPLGPHLVLAESSGYAGNGYVVCNTAMYVLSVHETSDRNTKTGIEPVSPADILDRVTSLPISAWAFTNAVSTRHVGPMAQDFYAAFGLGDDDKTIGPRDANGVALAAIQGLNQKVEAGSQRSANSIRKLEAENMELKLRLEKLERLLSEKFGGAQ
jgi:trimeric autotransporter adhesin